MVAIAITIALSPAKKKNGEIHWNLCRQNPSSHWLMAYQAGTARMKAIATSFMNSSTSSHDLLNTGSITCELRSLDALFRVKEDGPIQAWLHTGSPPFMRGKAFQEIGVRKVMGASVQQIVRMMSMEFIKLVAIAFILAVPLAWYAMSQWLEGFAYKIPMDFTIFSFWPD